MSRVIHIDTAGKERLLLTRNTARAIQELMIQSEINERTRDLASFIVIALKAIAKTIDLSVQAWEKRGYWLKADRFRLEWEWTERIGDKMDGAVLNEDWDSVALSAAQIAAKLKDIQLPKRPPKTEPWIGAWQRFKELHRPKG